MILRWFIIVSHFRSHSRCQRQNTHRYCQETFKTFHLVFFSSAHPGRQLLPVWLQQRTRSLLLISRTNQLYSSISPVGPDCSQSPSGSELPPSSTLQPSLSTSSWSDRKHNVLFFFFFFFCCLVFFGLISCHGSTTRHVINCISEQNSFFLSGDQCSISTFFRTWRKTNPKAAGLFFPLRSWTVDLSASLLRPHSSPTK